MHILYLLPQPFHLPRGSSFRADVTIKALQSLGHLVDVVCFDIGKKPPDPLPTKIHRAWRPPGINSVKIGFSGRKLMLDGPLYFKACQLASTRTYDVLHGVEEAGFMAARLGRKFEIPYIFDMHSWMSQQIENSPLGRWSTPLNLLKRMELWALKGASAVLTVGDDMTRILRDEMDIGRPVYTLPDCALPLPVDIPEQVTTTIREEYFSTPQKTLLYTGNYHTYQGIDLLLDSIAHLKNSLAKGSTFQVLLVGGGPAEHKIIDSARKRAIQLGIIENVKFCGERTPTEVAVFMQFSDVLVSPRITGNNVPLKIYTYLSAGVPIVATRVTSHTQILNDKNCILGEATTDSFAQALLRGAWGLSDSEKAHIIREAQCISPDQQWRTFCAVLDNCYGALRSSS